MTRPPDCNLTSLSSTMDEYCTVAWKELRDVLHPGQQAVGFAAVKRKLDGDFYSKKIAKANMKGANNSLPIVLGPNDIPYLVDSHHTLMALEASGYHSTKVELHKLCDWSHLEEEVFYQSMQKSNLLMGTGFQPYTNPFRVLPGPIDVTRGIPRTIPELKDDPWRSLAGLVRKVKDDSCPSDHKRCLRGYYRGCQDNGHTASFFEFRWAYFMNQAYLQGCNNTTTETSSSDWNDSSDCLAFESVMQDIISQSGLSIQYQDLDVWKAAAKLLVPLCRGLVAQSYSLPKNLGSPMGGQQLPGRIEGVSTFILEDDPDCAAPQCPALSLEEPKSSQTSPQVLPNASRPPVQSWAAFGVIMAAVVLVARVVTVKLANRQTLEYRLMSARKTSDDEIELQ